MSIFQFLCLAIVALVIQRSWADTVNAFIPKFLSERSFQNLTIITLAILFFLWQTKAGVKSGLDIHFLGVTTFTMMFGWRVACVLTLPVYGILAFSNQWPLTELPTQILISGFIPILLSYFIFTLSYHYLPKNIFVFIFVAGFFNAIFVGSTHLLLKGSYYLWQDWYDFTTVMENLFMLIPLMAFPEGLINGMALAVLCVYRPEWLRVFSDRHYLFPSK
ncbi:hypothetical protein HC752_06265 [Vibrio sp. S9_S30]|uniref:energy-coupling factor ABC transporter permease n=1 Tax=Vibrio sp. S9_S30 TaxID=2720226 RepID=UPI001681B5BD|nr:energy-coupling factor ABC transporter permease [Vibrio sp. S9_S30]MBD1556535.1 hypothetical protein [Vibrio sp. S9_S30]